MREDRIGETRIAKNGLKMTIIEYRSSRDVDIKFEDGIIVTNKEYKSFELGNIKHPNINFRQNQCKKEKIGQINIALNGQKMTIVEYRNANDIDIKFEDGTVVTNKAYKEFKNGCIKNPNLFNLGLKNNRIGETNKMSNGQIATIIKYNNCKDIDIKFEDDTIVTNKSYNSFKSGLVENPNKKARQKYNVGDSKIAKNGLKITIIAYRSSKDMDIQFEDGIIIKHINYIQWYNGTVKHPKNKKIGEKNIATNGQEMTIIDYRRSNDIDIKFEDGTIVRSKQYISFIKGNIKNPNMTYKHKRIGETKKANNGQMMTIIDYRRSDDIDIQFEDGTVVTNKSYQVFKLGTVEHPNINVLKHTHKINESKISKNGLKMVIIKYGSSRDVDVQFEDGFVAKNKEYQSFKNDTIGHPFPYQMDNILLKKKAYVDKNTGIGHFICNCNKCGYRDIWTIEECKKHKCIN